MDYEPTQIEHGDGIHFYRITPHGMWIWQRINKNIKDENLTNEDIRLLFSINIPDGIFDSQPFYVRTGIGSFKVYFNNLADAKSAMEYQLNMQLLLDPFEMYDAMVLAQIMNGELTQV